MLAKDTTNSFKPVPPGLHLARCYKLTDLGTQTSEYQGKINKLRKFIMQFEVHSESDDGTPTKMDDGQPMVISKTYTLSLGEKASLRADLASWRGRDFTQEELRGFSLENLLDKWAMISVIRATGGNGKEYSNISGIMPVPKKVRDAGLPKGHNEAEMFSLDLAPDMAIFDKLSPRIKEKIEASPEWAVLAKSDGPSFADEDVPF